MQNRFLKTKTGRVVLSALVMAIFLWLASTFLPHATVMGSLGDREIQARVARRFGAARFQSDGNTALIQLGRHEARATADEVILADGRRISIPTACRRLEFSADRQQIYVAFDGKQQR